MVAVLKVGRIQLSANPTRDSRMFSFHKSQLLAALVLLVLPAISFASPSVSGNIVTWPATGWYQVQRADTYETVCEGLVSAESAVSGGPCIIDSNSYIVINHTSGERFENVTAGGIAPVTSGVSVQGNRISWPDDGWYQVQNADTFASVCEGGRFCEVAFGSYVVINHSTGERFEGIRVGPASDSSSPDSAGVTVQDDEIAWPDDGWYQVQDSTDHATVCEGGRSCTVEPGNYVVIITPPVSVSLTSLWEVQAVLLQRGIPCAGRIMVGTRCRMQTLSSLCVKVARGVRLRPEVMWLLITLPESEHNWM